MPLKPVGNILWLIDAAVDTNSSVTIALVQDDRIGQFCCSGLYNTTTNTCMRKTHGSFATFSLPRGEAIFDRKNGATLTSIVQENGTSVQSSRSSEAVCSSNRSKMIAVGLGASTPVVLALFVAVFAALHFRRKSKGSDKREDIAHHTTPEMNRSDAKEPPEYDREEFTIERGEDQRYELQSPTSELPSSPVDQNRSRASIL